MPAHALINRTPEAVTAGLRAAEELCREKGVRFTPMRRTVLECLWEANQALGAYDLIRLLEARLGRQFAPPSVYRALDFLQEQGLVSRIATKNAFVPCAHPDHDHACVFFICEHCGSSAEIENAKIEELFSRDAGALGFRIGKRVVELQGICANCVSAEAVAN